MSDGLPAHAEGAGMSRHGTRWAWDRGCRCDGCRLAQYLYHSRRDTREWHWRMLPAEPLRQRLRAAATNPSAERSIRGFRKRSA
jgi:hypothetical protein